jgi:hypothetical protein
MGLLDSIETDLNTVWANSLGLVWSATTGTVDPWTNANIVAGAQADVTQALGPNADPATVATAQTGQATAIDSFLTSIGASPSQAGAGLANSISLLNPLNPASPFNLSSSSMFVLIAIALAAVFLYGYGKGR